MKYRQWRTVESGLSKQDWPTEPSAVYLGDGRILAIARVEGKAEVSCRAQLQLESVDYGKTWKRTRTNITDVLESTPSLLLDRGRIYNYYYQRMTGQLKCRTADPESIIGNPLNWSVPETVALASKAWHHAGNVNAVLYKNSHFLAFYSGDEQGTNIVVKIIREVSYCRIMPETAGISIFLNSFEFPAIFQRWDEVFFLEQQ